VSKDSGEKTQMPKIVPIVEGLGEVGAVPNLLSKMLHFQNCYDIYPDKPLNAKGIGNLTEPEGVEKFVKAAATRPDCGAILILVDADEECALTRSLDFARRIQVLGIPYPVVIVAAKQMYENWIIASIETIRGQMLESGDRIPIDIKQRDDIESCNGKYVLKSWLPPGKSYNEPIDQLMFTRLIEIEHVIPRSRSFRRLCHALEEAVAAIRTNTRVVTPAVTA
jgi:hypothetical protein